MKPKSNHKSIHHRTNKLFECTVAVHCFFSMRSANSTVGYRRLFFRIYTFFSSVWPVTASCTCMCVSVSLWLFVASSTYLHQHHALQTHLCLCASFSRPCNLSPPPALGDRSGHPNNFTPSRNTSLGACKPTPIFSHTLICFRSYPDILWTGPISRAATATAQW